MKQFKKDDLYDQRAARRLFKLSKYYDYKEGERHLLWLGAVAGQGYGYFAYGGKACRVHRVVWILVYGEIPDGLHVLHKCDRRICIDIKHLFLGTDTDNKIDMINKDREPGRNKSTGLFVPNSLVKISDVFKDDSRIGQDL